MIHTEHLRKADESYEIRHDNNGNAIHVYHTDGEAIVFPSLFDMITYLFTSVTTNVERFYLDESQLGMLYECESYEYYKVKEYWGRIEKGLIAAEK